MKIFVFKRRWLAAIPVAMIAVAIFYVVNFPAAVGVSGTTRELPIYCVERDQKVVSISFDAAWGDGRLR